MIKVESGKAASGRVAGDDTAEKGRRLRASVRKRAVPASEAGIQLIRRFCWSALAGRMSRGKEGVDGRAMLWGFAHTKGQESNAGDSEQKTLTSDGEQMLSKC